MLAAASAASAPRPSSTKTRIKTAPSQFIRRPFKLLRDHPPLKQGLRRGCYRKCVAVSGLRDHPPLKQGLRQALFYRTDCIIWASPRPSSTKTRIKTTQVLPINSLFNGTPRPSSTKTRIKTLCRGGRLDLVTPRPSSTKTRIKTTCNFSRFIMQFMLRDHPPLKQGLRPLAILCAKT